MKLVRIKDLNSNDLFIDLSEVLTISQQVANNKPATILTLKQGLQIGSSMTPGEILNIMETDDAK